MGNTGQSSDYVISRMGVSKVQSRANLIPPVTKIQLPEKSVEADLFPKSYKISLSTGEVLQTHDQLPGSEPLALCTRQF